MPPLLKMRGHEGLPLFALKAKEKLKLQKGYTTPLKFKPPIILTFCMLMPVSFSTTDGIFSIMSRTSPVSLDTPMSPLPLETIVTFFACDKGAEISAAIWKYWDLWISETNLDYFSLKEFLCWRLFET